MRSWGLPRGLCGGRPVPKGWRWVCLVRSLRPMRFGRGRFLPASGRAGRSGGLAPTGAHRDHGSGVLARQSLGLAAVGAIPFLGKLCFGTYVGGMAEQACSSVMRALAARSNPSSAPMRHAKCSRIRSFNAKEKHHERLRTGRREHCR
jgi:hypothetical protein